MAIWKLLGPDLQRIVSAAYELLMSGTCEKLTTAAEVSLEKSYIITEKQKNVFDAILTYWFSLSGI